MIITVYSDGGHAWGKVKKSDIRKLGANISTCSYQKGAYAYLEEDCDLPAFVDAWLYKNPTEQVEFNEICTEGESQIRRYERYESE